MVTGRQSNISGHKPLIEAKHHPSDHRHKHGLLCYTNRRGTGVICKNGVLDPPVKHRSFECSEDRENSAGPRNPQPHVRPDVEDKEEEKG
jgi:hypothetical protein